MYIVLPESNKRINSNYYRFTYIQMTVCAHKQIRAKHAGAIGVRDVQAGLGVDVNLSHAKVYQVNRVFHGRFVR